MLLYIPSSTAYATAMDACIIIVYILDLDFCY